MSFRQPFGSVFAFFRSNLGAALVLFFIALVVRLYHAYSSAFDGLYGQDAYAYYNYARELFSYLGRVQSPPTFWWPLGYPAVLSVSFLIGGVNIPSAQLITIVCGALIAPFAFALTVDSAPNSAAKIAGWVAGLLCALGGQLVQSSIVIMADAPALMWATLASWLLVRYARTGKLMELCIASFAVGMAVWTRWQNLIFAFVWLLALVTIQSKFLRIPGTKNAPGAAITWLPLLSAFAIIALVLLPQLVLGVSAPAPLAGSSWLEGWSPVNFFRRSFENIDGHFEYALPVAFFYGQVALHPAYLIALLLPLLGIGAITVFRRFRVSPHVAILLLGWSGGMYIFLAGIPYENFRFSLGLFVPLCVMTGLGAEWLWDRWQSLHWRWARVAWIGFALLVMLAWQPRVIEPVVAIKSAENAQIRELRAHLPADALVWTLGFTGPVETYTNLRARDLWQVTAAEIKATAPSYLFIDVQNLETQWRDHEPYNLYHALLESDSLEPAAQIQNRTLFRIK